MNRFIDMAAADVDEPVQFEMMCTLRTLQKYVPLVGLLY